MSRILVLYGTSEGHTEKVATIIANTLIASGCDADVIQAGTIDPALKEYDGVIVAASVHGGRFQKPVVACVRDHAGEIASKPNAFVEVCLAVLQKNDPKVSEELMAIVRRFSDETGWTPSTVKPVAGALPYTKYNFLVRWMMKRIVAKAGGDTDKSRDYVYTDWDALKAFASEFGRRIRAAAA
jgi:menaquinone-dependent protoporphyrinogen oxidase